MTAASDWFLEEVAGTVILRCAALSRIGGIAHGFSTRRGDGGNDYDLGGADVAEAGTERASEIMRRRASFLAATGVQAAHLVVLRQVHGGRIVHAASALTPTEADGVTWAADDYPATALSVRTADCVPVLLATRDGRAAAAVHAGWRGTAAGVVVRAVEALRKNGDAAADLTAALGPSIRPCCYPVGRAVASAVAEALPGRAGDGLPEGEGPFRLDLQDANRRQLTGAGVPAGQIHASEYCTSCRSDLFFSYRREKGNCGRMMAVIGPGRP